MQTTYRASARWEQNARAALQLTLMLALGLGVLARPDFAQAQTTGMTIYTGEPLSSGGLTISPWGSGSVEENLKTIYSGNASLKIVTHGYYQGASINFKRPFDLSAYATNKNALLQFALLIPETGANGASGRGGFPGARGGFPGGGSSPGGSSFPGGGSSPGSGGFPGAPGGAGGFPGAPGGPGGLGNRGGTMRTQQAHPLQHLRLLMLTTTGKPLEILAPLSYARDYNQWKLLSIPIPAINGLTGDDAKIQEVRIFGDASTTMFLGKIGVVVDSTPLKVETQDEKSVNVKIPYVYTATANAGATPLKYTWDWDSSDGIQEESVGRMVRHTYYKEGDYTVTITVSDAFGTKAPVTTTFKVHVHL